MDKIKNSEEFQAVSRIFDDYKINVKNLDAILADNSNLITLRTEYNDISRRILLISAANAFERHLIKYIPSVFSNTTDCILSSFITKQALSRKYHTLFKWEQDKTSKNANAFYSLFGENFKSNIRTKIDKNEELKQGENDFITLGHERNQIAHKGVKFAEFTRDIESVFRLYESSLLFYSFLCQEIKESYVN